MVYGKLSKPPRYPACLGKSGHYRRDARHRDLSSRILQRASSMSSSSPVRKSSTCSSNITILLSESALLLVKSKARQKAIYPAKTCLECLQDFSSTCTYEISSHRTQHTEFVEHIFPYKLQAFFCRVIHCPGWLFLQDDFLEWLILYHTELHAPSVSWHSAPSETDHPTADWICHHFLVCFSYKSHSVH